MKAVIADNVAAAAQLLERKVDPNMPEVDSLDFTALHFAAQNQSVAMAGLLLRHGAKVNARSATGNTPLWVAVFNYQGDSAIIELLLKNHADPNLKNNSGVSPKSLADSIANTSVRKFFAEGLYSAN